MDSHEVLSLKSGAVELGVSAANGKIERLDVAAGTQFSNLLVEKPADVRQIPSPGPADVFGIREAWGFDECFPTVGGATEWGIRDHGELWFRAAESRREGKSLITQWALPFGSFQRTIEASEPQGDLLGAFSFSVRFPRFFPVADRLYCRSLYAAHALFAIEAGDLLRILESDSSGERDVFRARFPEPDLKQARKLYFSFAGGMVARLSREKLGVELVMSGASCGLGLWWCNDGWGDGRPHRTVGIEPTNIPSDGPVFAHPLMDAQTEEELRFRIALWRRSPT